MASMASGVAGQQGVAPERGWSREHEAGYGLWLDGATIQQEPRALLIGHMRSKTCTGRPFSRPESYPRRGRPMGERPSDLGQGLHTLVEALFLSPVRADAREARGDNASSTRHTKFPDPTKEAINVSCQTRSTIRVTNGISFGTDTAPHWDGLLRSITAGPRGKPLERRDAMPASLLDATAGPLTHSDGRRLSQLARTTSSREMKVSDEINSGSSGAFQIGSRRGIVDGKSRYLEDYPMASAGSSRDPRGDRPTATSPRNPGLQQAVLEQGGMVILGTPSTGRALHRLATSDLPYPASPSARGSLHCNHPTPWIPFPPTRRNTAESRLLVASHIPETTLLQ
ncbi:hypothetical protein B0J13DRAFT_605142 [Dactylonectria estremocensis]|uniref:Uncharacterized protein n=1 Tax=Dactylonectria estremocensis TaxID=1079267 RepID=A0A9P9J5Q4_9HYPO|nr:hypothetical protein B0J13DRAFT_605142 [Dactylonectria estremocensis]